MKKAFLASLVLLLITFTRSFSYAEGWESSGDKVILNIQSYVWYDMEEMVNDFPNGSIPYRGSDTIYSLNNSVVCYGTGEGVGIKSFVQTNNVFPVIWSTEISIGMSYSDLMGVLQNWISATDEFTIELIENEDIQLVKVNYKSQSTQQYAYFLQFYICYGQVYQIEFESLD